MRNLLPQKRKLLFHPRKRPPKVTNLYSRPRHMAPTKAKGHLPKEGTVESLKVVSGHPLLIQSAIETAKQLRYRPYLQNGQPVAFNTRIAVRFTLIAQ